MFRKVSTSLILLLSPNVVIPEVEDVSVGIFVINDVELAIELVLPTFSLGLVDIVKLNEFKSVTISE